MEHSDDPGSPNTSTFSARQYAHHTDTLRSKWECSEPGHTVCVPTRDNQHFRLDDRHVADWARALCAGTATTAEPPHALFEHIRGGFVWNRTNGGERVEAVSIAPSRRTASSIRGTSTVSSMNASSGVLGPGYLSGKMFKWFGTKGLDAVEDMFIMKRANGHVDTLRGWEKRPRALGDRERKEVYGMLTDALEMARQCYPAKVNRAAFNIGREVYLWLHAHPLIPQTPEMLRWLITVQICLIPLLLTRISAHDPLAADLAHSTLSALTRSPLSVDDPDIPADVICLVVRELAYARCAAQHAWLGFSLLSIIEMSIKVRGLMPREISAIGELVARRKHAHTPNARPHKKDRKASVTPDLSRPWEVALFAQCAALEHQDHSPASPTSPASPSPARALHDQPAHNTPQNPAATAVSPSQPDPSISASPITLFTSSVLGPAGLPSLLTALNTLLAPSTLHWENIALTVRALAALSLHGWVWEGIEGLERVEGEKGVVKALLGVFR
ncbi:hypothetical protein K439DRAFT_410719 [Ramaria rubella]|nr:hypothetical protein K439DRAFT_410719 [Ramaria rubella]